MSKRPTLTQQPAERTPAFSVTAKDVTWQTFRSGGPGGQNQNKRDTGVRVIHEPSGARGESRECRTQLENRKAAFRRMAHSPAFTYWATQKLREMEGRESAEAWVDRQLADPKNLLIERRGEDGTWEPWDGAPSPDDTPSA